MPTSERIKSITTIAQALLDDGYINEQDAKRVKQAPLSDHPITTIVGLEIGDLTNGGRAITGETLGEWWSKEINFPYYSVNPLKINVQAVTK